MALVVNDRVKETSTTTGTGTLNLAGAVSGFQTFVAGVGDTNTTYYAIFNQGTTEWEVGLGTVTDAATDTLARTTVISSSNSGSAVDFAAGTKDVFCTLPASKAVFGKQEGTNFSDSLIVGHSTTGSLTAATANTFVGIDAGEDISQGDQNTSVGQAALGNITTGGYNTAIGQGAVSTVTTQNYNVGIGRGALNSVEADYNLGLGNNAGDNITTGSGNVIIGHYVDPSSATADHQFKIGGNNGSSTVTWLEGDSAGKLVATAGDVVTGKVGGTDFTDSILVGHNTTGTLNAATKNVGVGLTALDALTAGDNNVAVGWNAGTSIDDGNGNVHIGRNSGLVNEGGQNNTSIGISSFYFGTDSDSNVAIGNQALFGASGQNHDDCIAIGQDSLVAVSSGDNNIGIGYQAGNNITSGSGNVVIGNADVASATGDDQLSISDNVDGSVLWITGDSSGTVSANGGELTTTGKAFVMGF